MELCCTLTIEACLKLNMFFVSRYLDLLNTCMLKLVYTFTCILLNVRNGMDLISLNCFSENIIIMTTPIQTFYIKKSKNMTNIKTHFVI